MHTHTTKDGELVECEYEAQAHYNDAAGEVALVGIYEWATSVYYPPLPDGSPDPRDGWTLLEKPLLREVERLRAGIRELTNHLQTHARRPCWCGMDFVAEATALLETP